jgi:glycosidase
MIYMIALLIVSCSNTTIDAQKEFQSPTIESEKQPPKWLKSATIYQINTRQFTSEGTLQAAAKQLPRLKKLGIDVLWLMPIHPIGEKNRKGSLGSPYSVQDYFAVNPEIGNKQDMKQFVKQAHDLGMYVILDWVANHTAWDNVIHETHPEWYIKDFKNDNIPTLWFDWDDIIDLDFSNLELQDYMIEAMSYWVGEVGVDGYRCDAAGLVPNAFWKRASQTLNQIKPVFMLAEWEGPQFYEHGFDATYAWSWWETMHKIAQGKAKANALHSYYAWNDGYYPDRAMRLMYVSNHDVNSWEATQFEAFGDALSTAITLSVVSEGIPMIYNGQEAGNPKRLAFFERDTIEWQPHPIGDLYQNLFALKKSNSALWNAKWGARMLPIHNDNSENVLSFVRANEQDKVVAIFNLSAEPQTVHLLDSPLFEGQYQRFSTSETLVLSGQAEFNLKPWESVVLIK